MSELAYATKADRDEPTMPPLREVLRDHIELLAKEIDALKEVLSPVLGAELKEPGMDKFISPHSSELAGNLDALFVTIGQLRAVRERIEL